MSKREEMRDRRRQQQTRNRILVILLVVTGAAILTFVLIIVDPHPLPGTAQQTQTSVGVVNLPVTPITSRTFNTTVDGTHIGNPDAPVKIDVWEDFQCPACKQYSEQTEPAVIADFVETGQVYYTFHFYPFIDGGTPGGESQQSANAAMCALEQGRFWDFHDMLFANWAGENQGGFADSRLLTFAESLELDMTAFNACFIENRYADEIQRDVVLGQGFGVSGTPSVFVNGTNLTPGFIPSYDDVAQAVQAALDSGQ